MTGKELKELTTVSELAPTQQATVTLEAKDGRLRCYYQGPYTGAERWIQYSGDFAAEVQAKPLKAAADLFSDVDQIQIKRADPFIILKGLDRGSKLRIAREAVIPPAAITPHKEGAAEVTLDELKNELTLAFEFAAELGSSHQILTGVRLLFKQDQLRFVATDGVGLLLASSLVVQNGEEGDACVPPGVLVGLKVHTDPTVLLEIRGNPGSAQRLVVSSSNATFHCALLAGKWPDLRGIMEQTERVSLKLSAQQLKELGKAAKEFGSAYDVDCFEIESKGGLVSLQSLETEAGQAKIGLLGADYKGSVAYNTKYLAKLVKLGDELNWQIPLDGRSTSIASCERRKAWIAPMYVAKRLG